MPRAPRAPPRPEGIAELLRRAPLRVRRDRAIVLGAVRCDGRALAAAATALRGDRELVHAAVLRHPEALRHAERALREGDPVLRLLAAADEAEARARAAEADAAVRRLRDEVADAAARVAARLGPGAVAPVTGASGAQSRRRAD